MNQKTTTLFKTVIVSTFLLLYNLVQSANKNDTCKIGKSNFYLEIDMQFSTKIKKNLYKVELIHNNCVMDSIIIKNNKPFKFLLNRNANYRLRVTKKGCVPELVTVCTNLPGSECGNSDFKFRDETKGVNESEKNLLWINAIDFPVAVISVEQERGWLYYTEKYAAHIKKRIDSKQLANL